MKSTRKLFLLLIAIISINDVKSQDINKMINESLMMSIETFASTEGIIIDDFPRNFIFTESITRFGLPFFSLHQNRLKSLRRGKFLLYFGGPELNGNELVFTYSLRNTQKKGKNLNIAISDWLKFHYQYSCETNTWNLDNIEKSGVAIH